MLKNSLEETLYALQRGQDQTGLQQLFNGLEDLENLLIHIYYAEGPYIDEEALLKGLHDLHGAIKHRDITAMTDTLALTILPLFEKWMGGADGDHCQRE